MSKCASKFRILSKLYAHCNQPHKALMFRALFVFIFFIRIAPSSLDRQNLGANIVIHLKGAIYGYGNF
nr:hypothetical protein BCU49_18260 [Vibrio breoganii]